MSDGSLSAECCRPVLSSLSARFVSRDGWSVIPSERPWFCPGAVYLWWGVLLMKNQADRPTQVEARPIIC